jgi:hypothetical protein
MKIIVISTFPDGEVRVRFASQVHYMPHHMDGAPVMFVDESPDWTGTPDWTGKHECRSEYGDGLLSIDLGEMDETKKNAIQSYWSRLRGKVA